MTPAWRPDGQAIIAAADLHDAVFNLYEVNVDAPTERRQLTHTTGGATWPDVSPDGKTIVYVGYTADGFDLFQTAYTPGACNREPAVCRLESAPDRRCPAPTNVHRTT